MCVERDMVVPLLQLVLNIVQVASIGVGFVWLLEGALVFATLAILFSVLIVIAERKISRQKNTAIQ
jgi:hypothetical protein